MLKSALKSLSLAILAGITALAFTLPAGAQQLNYNDPNRDYAPVYLFHRAPASGDLPLSTVITVNNFDNFNLGVDFGESNVAENLANPASYFTAYNINVGHHTENGIDWADVIPTFGTTMQGDPVVAYDSLGNLFYENMYGSISGVKVVKSIDNGATWNTAVTGILGVDKNWMAADQTSGPYANYVYTTMTANSGGNFARSTDHGATWTTTWNAASQSLPGMMVCVGPNGAIQGKSVYVVTNGGSSFAATYTFYRSLDGGATFTQMSAQNFANYVGSNVGGRNSVQNMRTRPYPMIAADNSYGSHRGRLYCVYASNDPPGNGNKPDIWCNYSDDGGATWSTATKVNDDANTTTHHQWHPSTWCDKQTGRLYAMWMDTRDCPTNDSALIYASYSDNGGTTWAPNQAISNQKMKIDCASCGGGGTPRYEGDYNGIVSNKKVSMVNWTDFRQGTFMSAMGYFPDFAVAVTPASDTLYITNDSTNYTVNIPAVKLYTDTVVLSAQITPSPSAGSLTISYPQGDKITAFPGSKPVRIKLTGNVPQQLYTITFFAKGPNGTPAHSRNASLRVMVGQTMVVGVSANPPTVCTGGTTQLMASASGGTSPYTYTWTSNPAGFSSALANPVASPTVNTRYICTVHDNASHIAKDSVMVTISTAPAAPGAIAGNTTPCSGNTESYSIAPVTGATSYTWTVPSGATILSGQTSSAINVQWGTTSGDITVTAVNTCGNSPLSQLAVTVTPQPNTPGPISGPTTLCTGTPAVFSVPEVVGQVYTWTVPPDATITSGQGTDSISVLWGMNAGFVSVTAQTGACISMANSLGVNTEVVPTAAQAINGPDTVCQGTDGHVFSIPPIANASTYTLTLPVGATIMAGQGTSAITVDFGASAVSGAVTAAGNNLCGTGPASSKDVIVQVCAGTDEQNFRARVRIYPNPVHGLLNFAIDELKGALQAVISDVDGRTLWHRTFDPLPNGSIRQIDVSRLTKGIYLLKLQGESGVFIGKFSVE